jgi:hypothetical protein
MAEVEEGPNGYLADCWYPNWLLWISDVYQYIFPISFFIYLQVGMLNAMLTNITI